MIRTASFIFALSTLGLVACADVELAPEVAGQDGDAATFDACGVLEETPTVDDFVFTWARKFHEVARNASGADRVLTLNEAQDAAASTRSEAKALWADNAVDYLMETGLSQVDLTTLDESAVRYAFAQAGKVRDENDLISLEEGGYLVEDLRGDYFYLRGRTQGGRVHPCMGE